MNAAEERGRAYRALRELVPYGLSSLLDNEYSFIWVHNRAYLDEASLFKELFMPGYRYMPKPQIWGMAYHILVDMQDLERITYMFPELRDGAEIPVSSDIQGSFLVHCYASHFARWAYPIPPSILRHFERCVVIDPGALSRPIPAEDKPDLPDSDWLSEGMTPMWVMLCGSRYDFTPRCSLSDRAWPQDDRYHDEPSYWVPLDHYRRLGLPVLTNYILSTWLSSLQDIDVDLLEYGRNERKLEGHVPTRANVFMNRLMWDQGAIASAMWQVIGVAYGSRIEDWYIEWAWNYEYFAKEFWDMIEDPPMDMPGAWEESQQELEAWTVREYQELARESIIIWTEVS